MKHANDLPGSPAFYQDPDSPLVLTLAELERTYKAELAAAEAKKEELWAQQRQWITDGKDPDAERRARSCTADGKRAAANARRRASRKP